MTSVCEGFGLWYTGPKPKTKSHAGKAWPGYFRDGPRNRVVVGALCDSNIAGLISYVKLKKFRRPK